MTEEVHTLIQLLSKVDTEAEQLIGGVDEDILELFTQRRQAK